MLDADQTAPPTEPTVASRPDEPALVIRRIRKPDGRYLLLYTFLRETEHE